ncbi:MAG: hypothetical protein N3A69_10140 [Leptospiraceae bacterium]|nr:hypothetical protein [Leptospiraceae bacterium]
MATLIDSISILLPQRLKEAFLTLRDRNPHIKLELQNKTLIIKEKDFSFSEISFFELNLTFPLTDEEHEKLNQFNYKAKLLECKFPT